MEKIIIVNGPNLNLLGEREKTIWNFYIKDIENECKNYGKNNLAITLYQSNIEGELVEKIQDQEKNQNGFNNKRRATSVIHDIKNYKNSNY